MQIVSSNIRNQIGYRHQKLMLKADKKEITKIMLFCVVCTYFSSLIKITLLVFLIVYHHVLNKGGKLRKKKKPVLDSVPPT